jgi:hypothetical protein
LESPEVPSEEIITVMTVTIFDKLKRASNGNITKLEFEQWCSSTLEALDGSNFDAIYKTFCSGGPLVEEDEPEDGIPKLLSATESSPAKKVNKIPDKKPVFLPSPSKGSAAFNEDVEVCTEYFFKLLVNAWVNSCTPSNARYSSHQRALLMLMSLAQPLMLKPDEHRFLCIVVC